MRATNSPTVSAMALALTLALSGCVSRSVHKPHGGGYGIITYYKTTDFVHTGMRMEINHWTSAGKRTRIWPFGSDLIQHSDVALFEGFVYKNWSEGGNRWLFAVHGVGPPAVIEGQVIALCRQQVRSSSAERVSDKSGYVSKIEKAGTNFSIRVSFGGDRHGVVELSRDQVLAMISEAEKQGQRVADGRYPSYAVWSLREDL